MWLTLCELDVLGGRGGAESPSAVYTGKEEEATRPTAEGEMAALGKL